LNAQRAGAVGVVIVSDRTDLVFPRVSRWKFPAITIPALLIGNDKGAQLIASIKANPNKVNISMTDSARIFSNLYSPALGLGVFNMTTLRYFYLILYLFYSRVTGQTVPVAYRTDWFSFARRIFVDRRGNPDLNKYIYISGTDTNNGGLTILGVEDPLNPTLVGQWSESYLHDFIVETCGNKRIAFAISGYDKEIFIIDVTDATKPTTLSSYITKLIPSRIWVLSSNPERVCTNLYVTFEDSRTMGIYNLTSFASTSSPPDILYDQSFIFPENNNDYQPFLVRVDNGTTMFVGGVNIGTSIR
jgi:hypothetical protein